jgi:hypothetical protein
MFIKGLITRICRELLQETNNKTPNNQIKKQAQDWRRHFSKHTQMANKYTNRHLTSLINKKIPVKTIKRYYLIFSRMGTIKNKH